MIEIVLKIGGSLCQSKKMAELTHRLTELGPTHGILVVPGGGIFADVIRDYDHRFGLDRNASHWMAILAMDQYGHLISSLIQNCELVLGLAEARKVLAQGRLPILLPYSIIYQSDALPRSWHVTSDSIAAWVAGLAGARQLILLKPVDGLFTGDPWNNPDSELLETINLKQLGGCSGVDRHLSSILSKNDLDLWVVNGKHPNRLVQLMEDGFTKGTRLLRSGF